MIIDYGELVKIKDDAPEKFRPGSIGSVVSLYEVKTTEFKDATDFEIDKILIGVEISDGTFLDVPLEFVSILEHSRKNK